MDAKDLNELQAMHIGLLIHKVQRVQLQQTTVMKDRIDVLDWDMLSTYDQDVLHLLAFVVREMLVAPAFGNHFLC